MLGTMKRSYNILQYILLSIILIMVVSMVYDCSDNRKQYLVGVHYVPIKNGIASCTANWW